MAQNNVLLTIYFKNLPDSNSKEYAGLMSKLKHNNWNLKHNILSKPSTEVDHNYYELHSDFYKLLSKNDVKYSKEIAANTVSYDLYEQFSKVYDIDLDVQVSKTGKHVAECLDVGSVNYYNHLRTLIKDGCITSQSFSHLSSDGRLAQASVEFSKGECQKAMKELYPLLMSKLDAMNSSVGDYSLESTDTELDVENDLAAQSQIASQRALQAQSEISLMPGRSYDFQK